MSYGQRKGEKAMTEAKRIRLGQYLKLAGLVATGGEAKHLIQGGEVRVNGQVETRRKRQLVIGDVVTLGGQTAVVGQDGPSIPPPQAVDRS